MVNEYQEIEKPNNNTLRLLTKFIRWVLYTILFVGFVIPTVLLSYLYIDSESKVIKLSFLSDFVEDSLEQHLLDYDIEVASAGVTKGNTFFSPELVFNDVRISFKNEEFSYLLPKAYTTLGIFFQNNSNITIQDAQLLLKRNKAGKFDVAPNDNDKVNLLEKIDFLSVAFSKLPILGRVNQLDAENISISYYDDKTNNNYFFENGNVTIKKNNVDLSVSGSFDLIKENGEKSVFIISGNHKIDDENFNIILKMDNADPITLANQISAFAWLRNVDTNVNTSIITSFDRNANILDMDGVIELSAGHFKATPKHSLTKFLNLKTYFEYDLSSDILNFPNIDFKSDQLSVIGSAKNILIRDNKENIIAYDTELKIADITINRPDMFDKKTISLKSGSAKLITNIEPFNITFLNSRIKNNETNFRINGELKAQNDYWESDLNLKIDNLEIQQIIDFWPLNYNVKARKWVLNNVNSSRFSNIKGNVFSSNGKRELDFIFNFDDTSINALKSVVPLENISGEGSMSDKQITFSLESGKFKTSENLFSDLSGSIFHIPNTKEKPVKGQMKLNAQGNIKSFFEILNSDRFKYLEKAGIGIDFASGKAELDGWIEWPLVKGVNQDQVMFSIDGVLSSVKSKNIIKERLFESENLSLKISDKKISIYGKSQIDNFPLKFSWKQNFKDNPEKISFLDAKFTIDKNGLETFNISLPEGMLEGSVEAELKLNIKPKNKTRFVLNSNLEGAEININSLGWNDADIKKGNLNVRGSLSTPVDIEEIKILADDLNANGKINFENNGQFKSAVFPVIKISDWLSTSLTVSKTENVNIMKLEGGEIDFRNLVFGKNNSEVGFLKVALDSLRISDGIEFTNLRSDIDFSKKELGNFKAQVNGGADIYGKLSKGEFGTIITVNGDNAGHILRSAGILKNIRGGELDLVLTPNENDGYYTGRFIVNKFRMLHSNPLALLLDSLSLVGLVDKLENEGIQFNQAKGWLNITPDGIQLSDVSLVGLSMGMSITGWYDKAKKAINFDGVVTPVYAINGVFERLAGKLFGEQKGEGLFSFVYTMKGPTTAPVVAVKPLSILTPGGFRKIFRADIPAPSK